MSLVLAKQMGFYQRAPDVGDLIAAQLHERRTDDGARQLTKKHERFLHAIVHIDNQLRVEYTHGRIDTVFEALRFGKVV
jgi:hypothetical protein